MTMYCHIVHYSTMYYTAKITICCNILQNTAIKHDVAFYCIIAHIHDRMGVVHALTCMRSMRIEIMRIPEKECRYRNVLDGPRLDCPGCECVTHRSQPLTSAPVKLHT